MTVLVTILVPTWLDTNFGATWGQNRSPERSQKTFVDRLFDQFGTVLASKNDGPFPPKTPLFRTRVDLRPGLGDLGHILALLDRFWLDVGRVGPYVWHNLGLLVPMLVAFWLFWDPLLGIPGICLMPFWDPVRAFRTAFSARLWDPKRKQERTPQDTSHGLGTVADTAAAAAPG